MPSRSDNPARPDVARTRVIARVLALALIAAFLLGGLALAGPSQAGPCAEAPRVPYGKVLRMWGDVPTVTIWNSIRHAPRTRGC